MMYKTDPKDSPPPMDNPARKSATIVTATSGGTYYSADCPYCGVPMPVGGDLSIMFSCCNSCNKSFYLRYPSGGQSLKDDKPATDDATDDGKKDDDSSRPFNPPPAKPKFPSAPYGSPYPLRGPQNWPVHYDGRHN